MTTPLCCVRICGAQAGRRAAELHVALACGPERRTAPAPLLHLPPRGERRLLPFHAEVRLLEANCHPPSFEGPGIPQ